MSFFHEIASGLYKFYKVAFPNHTLFFISYSFFVFVIKLDKIVTAQTTASIDKVFNQIFNKCT